LLSQLEAPSGLLPQEEREKARGDSFYLLENQKLFIKTKAAELIPLELNHDQKLILDGLVKSHFC
jgi:hypothetical protein